MLEPSTELRDFILAPGEALVQCPYNLAHIVTNAKIIMHLVKCRKQYEKDSAAAGKTELMKSCRWNDNHRYWEPELKFHEDRCEDRFNVVETIRYHNSEEFSKPKEEGRDRDKDKDKDRKHKHKRKDKDRDRERSKSRDRKHDRDRHRDRESDRKDRDRHRDRDRDREKDRHHHPKDRDIKDGHRRHSFDNKPAKRPRVGSQTDIKPPRDADPNNVWGSDAEDWEADADSKGNAPAYQPMDVEKLKTLPLYQPAGLSKSERKSWRMQLRDVNSSMNPNASDDNYDYDEDYEDGQGQGYCEPVEIKPLIRPDIKPIIKKEEARTWEELAKRTVKQERRTPPRKVPPPKVIPPPIDLEKEDGECSEDDVEDFVGEDPFS